MIVVYAEKPDMGRKIATALADKGSARSCNGHILLNIGGSPAAVTWGFGHMYEMKDAKEYNEKYAKWDADIFPFFPQKYEIKPKKGVGQQIKIVSELFKKAGTIVNATDADREGELIFDYVVSSVLPATARKRCEIKRMWMHATTPEALREAYNTAKDIKEYENTRLAARTRAVFDWISGINLTVLATKRFPEQSDGPVSIGRVQTPTLALMVVRELEIRNFKSETFWNVTANFKTHGADTYKGVYVAQHSDSSNANTTPKRLKKAEAEAILNTVNGHKGTIASVSAKPETQLCPLLYDLAALQMKANDRFGFTAEKTLNIAQKLYEDQYTTYPRTSSRYLPENMKDQVTDILNKLGSCPEYSRYFDIDAWQPYTKRHFDDKKVESHYALMPTGRIPKAGVLSDDEAKVYGLIAESLIRIIYPPMETLTTKVITTVNGCDFLSKGKVVKVKGWSAVGESDETGKAKAKNEDGADNAILPPLNKGDNVTGAFALKEGKTMPPKRYTDKSLLVAMENAGNALEDKESASLLKNAGIGTPSTRAAIIETVIKRQYATRKGKTFIPTEKGIKLIEFLPVEALKSAEMTGNMEKRLLNIENGKEDPATVLREFEKTVADWCATIKALPAPHFGYSAKNTDSTTETVELGKCPVCGQAVVKLHGRYGSYCKCTGDSCKFSINMDNLKLDDRKTKALLNGETVAVSGVKSKKGKTFSANLMLDNNGEVKFDFPKRGR